MKARMSKLSAKQNKEIQQQVSKEFDKLLHKYTKDISIMILYILRFEFGFGQKRLQKFISLLAKMKKELHYNYELPETDTFWLCEKKLEESGINVKALMGDMNE